MRLISRRLPWIALLSLPMVLVAGALLAAKSTTLIFEGEQVANLSGKGFVFKKYVEDPTGKVSGNKVLAVPKCEAGSKPTKDTVTYKVRIPVTGVYYLWARTFWSTGCGNSFLLQVQGYDTDKEWIIGGDGTYDALHWVCLNDSGDNRTRPRPLRLKKGVVAFTLGVKEGGTMVDEFLLTTDALKRPEGCYKPTPDVLEMPPAKK